MSGLEQVQRGVAQSVCRRYAEAVAEAEQALGSATDDDHNEKYLLYQIALAHLVGAKELARALDLGIHPEQETE